MTSKELKVIQDKHKRIIDLLVNYVDFVADIDLEKEGDFSDLTDGVLNILLEDL